MSEKYFVHASSYIDEQVVIGEGTKIWHFSHVSKGAVIGSHCNFGQNVFIGNGVKIREHIKIQNDVRALYCPRYNINTIITIRESAKYRANIVALIYDRVVKMYSDFCCRHKDWRRAA